VSLLYDVCMCACVVRVRANALVLLILACAGLRLFFSGLIVALILSQHSFYCGK
jgi:hypothetical protein